jgi:Uma2 family endonuclease
MTVFLIESHNVPLTVNFPMTVPMTLEQFHAFCQVNRDLRIERTATGEVIIMPPAFSDTGNRNFNLAARVWVWAERDGTGIGFDSSAGFTLPDGAIRSPDVAWIKLERWNRLTEKEKASFAPICPDFVIESRSASDRLSAVQDKMREYIANGVLLGWLIDSQNRRVYLYRSDREVEILENPESVSGDPGLSGFVLQMDRIW